MTTINTRRYLDEVARLPLPFQSAPITDQETTRDQKGRSTKKGSLLTQQSPKIEPKQETYMEKLEAYMQALIDLQVDISHNQAQVSSAQTSISKIMIQNAEKQLDEVRQGIAKYEKEKRKAHRSSLCTKIFGGIAAALCVVLAVATGGALTCLVALSVMAITMSGASDKLDHAMEKAGIPAGARFAIKIAMVLAATALTCGVGGLAEVAAAGAQDIEEAAAEESSSLLSKVADQGFTKTNLYASAGGYIAAFNPGLELVSMSTSMIPMSKRTRDMVNQIVGTLTSIILGLVCGSAAMSAAESEDAVSLSRLTTKLRISSQVMRATSVANTAAMAGLGGSLIALGIFTKRTGDGLLQVGKAEGDMSLFQSLISIMGGQEEVTGRQTASLQRSLQEVTNHFNDFVRPGQVVARELSA
jgi:hypothetical protein